MLRATRGRALESSVGAAVPAPCPAHNAPSTHPVPPRRCACAQGILSPASAFQRPYAMLVRTHLPGRQGTNSPCSLIPNKIKPPPLTSLFPQILPIFLYFHPFVGVLCEGVKGGGVKQESCQKKNFYKDILKSHPLQTLQNHPNHALGAKYRNMRPI